MHRLLCVGLALLLGAASCANAVALHPASDDEVIETLPTGTVSGVAARRVQSAHEAAALARAWIDQARASGDPRPVGRAMAALQPWVDGPRASSDAVLMMAIAEQYVHDFDRAMARLQRLVTRTPDMPQAWLTLATLQRLKGRYAESDRSCAALLRLGAEVYGQACLAENQSLRGQAASARATLRRLIATVQDEATRGWLSTTLAEVEERAGRFDTAEATFRRSLVEQPDGYAALAFADLLIYRGRGAEARAVLQAQPRSDAVLLRLALANPHDAEGQAAAAELRRRFAQAAERPGATQVHARERAVFAWRVDGHLDEALALARADVAQQREPADLLLLAQIGVAAHDASAQAQLRQLIAETGLHDARIDALL